MKYLKPATAPNDKITVIRQLLSHSRNMGELMNVQNTIDKIQVVKKADTELGFNNKSKNVNILFP